MLNLTLDFIFNYQQDLIDLIINNLSAFRNVHHKGSKNFDLVHNPV